jgi:hypothetical protein
LKKPPHSRTPPIPGQGERRFFAFRFAIPTKEIDAMEICQSPAAGKPGRERLPNRRGNISFNFLHDGRVYHATATRYQDDRLAEIFLDVGKAGSTVQQHAEATAVLASLALQNGVAVETIIHAVSGGPLANALELASAP